MALEAGETAGPLLPQHRARGSDKGQICPSSPPLEPGAEEKVCAESRKGGLPLPFGLREGLHLEALRTEGKLSF